MTYLLIAPTRRAGDIVATSHLSPLLNRNPHYAPKGGRRFHPMYSILYIIGAIVVIIVVLRLLGLY